MAHSPDCDPEVKKRAYEVSSRNDMAVVRDFYTQFEWAKEDDWKSLTTIPTLICQGKDDKITPLDGALKLQEFIATQTRLQDQTQLSESSEGTNTNTDQKGTAEVKRESEGVALTIIEKAGHQLMLERPSEVAKAIEDFIVTDCGFATFRHKKNT
jgi:pimeloyl-ACP methyl ester carboxylesterase